MGVQHMTVTLPKAPKDKKEKLETIFIGQVDKLVLKHYYDLHGDIIWMREQDATMEDKMVKLQKRRYWNTLLDTWMTTVELFIDGEQYEEMEITGIHGGHKKLEITGCVGAG